MKFLRRKKGEKQVHTQKTSKSDYYFCLAIIFCNLDVLILLFPLLFFNELEAQLLKCGFLKSVNRERNFHGREISDLRKPRGRAGHLETDRKNVAWLRWGHAARTKFSQAASSLFFVSVNKRNIVVIVGRETFEEVGIERRSRLLSRMLVFQQMWRSLLF